MLPSNGENWTKNEFSKAKKDHCHQVPPGFLHTVNSGKLELHFGVQLVSEVVRYKYEKQVWNLLTNSLKKPFDRNFSNSKFVMKDQTNQKTKTTIVIQTLQSSFGCILAPFCEYRHLRVMGTVQDRFTKKSCCF